MALIKRKPTSPGRRFQVVNKSDEITNKKNRPEKSLVRGKVGSVGRSNGKVSIRHRQQGAKKLFREIDFKRQRFGIEAVVQGIEYDPNRSANIALLYYTDGVKSYILAPVGLEVGQKLFSNEKTVAKVGNSMKLKNIPDGTVIHCVELKPGKGAQIARGAGTGIVLLSKEGKIAMLKLPSSEVKRVNLECMATVGQVGNVDHKNTKVGKAGRNRYKGKRPQVRGVAMHPAAHPHGGGEGRSGIGMPAPKTPWGKKTLGVKTRKRKHTDKFLVRRRK